MEIESPAALENAKKRKNDGKKDTEVKVNERTTDIRTFFTPLPNKVSHAYILIDLSWKRLLFKFCLLMNLFICPFLHLYFC